MQDFEGKTAVVTGAGSGIGAGMARVFARAGMNVAVCDIRADAAAATAHEVEAAGGRAVALTVDVSDHDSVRDAADGAERAFGRIHVACNNAGVTMMGVPLEALQPVDWDWIIGVNLRGVIHGIEVFTPRIRRHGEAGHVVNTASIGGFRVRAGWNGGAYAMTKYGVVALSEALEQEVAGSSIGVSVLCPMAVNTAIPFAARARPGRFGGPFTRPEDHFQAELLRDGLHPDVVGERLLDAIRTGEFFVFTHPSTRAWIEERHGRLMEAYDAAERWWSRRPPATDQAPARMP